MYEFIRIDQDWIPKEDGYSLYIRPTIIGIDPDLSISVPKQVKIICNIISGWSLLSYRI